MTSLPRTLTRLGLGAALVFAGATHLTVARDEFQAQVPEWVPLSKDATVLASGVAEISLGTALIAAPKHLRPAVGLAAAAFFVAIFPGNVHQLTHRIDAFGLDTDLKRLLRLPFQPALVAAAWWSTAPTR